MTWRRTWYPSRNSFGGPCELTQCPLYGSSVNPSWTPATIDEVVSRFERELRDLEDVDRIRLEAARVEPRRVPIESRKGETVVAIAEFGARVLYWEDVDEGWEIEERSPSGGVPGRFANQFELAHIAYQLR